MRPEIEVDDLRKRIELTWRGPVSFADRVEAMDIVTPMLGEGGLTRVLIDYTHAWVAEDASAVSYSTLRARSAEILKGCWVAIVNPPEFHAIPTEEAACDVGFPVRRFYTRGAACDWLDSRLS
jgi:hypothetical protein